jgi:hypothetical protein
MRLTPSPASSGAGGMPGPASTLSGPLISLRGDVRLGSRAAETFRSVGVEPAEVEQNKGRRRFAFACPDWTEHRPHLGGALGAAVCERFFVEGWIGKDENTRAVRLTDVGASALEERLGLVDCRPGLEEGKRSEDARAFRSRGR